MTKAPESSGAFYRLYVGLRYWRCDTQTKTHVIQHLVGTSLYPPHIILHNITSQCVNTY